MIISLIFSTPDPLLTDNHSFNYFQKSDESSVNSLLLSPTTVTATSFDSYLQSPTLSSSTNSSSNGFHSQSNKFFLINLIFLYFILVVRHCQPGMASTASTIAAYTPNNDSNLSVLLNSNGTPIAATTLDDNSGVDSNSTRSSIGKLSPVSSSAISVSNSFATTNHSTLPFIHSSNYLSAEPHCVIGAKPEMFDVSIKNLINKIIYFFI